MREYSVRELLLAVEGELIYGNEDSTVYDVKIDSRQVGLGDLFFAIKGENTDGHLYLGQVIEKGCRTLVVSDEDKVPKEAFLGSQGDVNIIVVEDTLKALQKLAKNYLDGLNTVAKIGVTGSVGKTSTRDMLYYISSTKYKTGRNPKNYNNAIGLPLAILGLDIDTQVAVLEMGMEHKGEIETLVDIVRPDIGVITNVGVSHIENLGSREGILAAKLELTKNFDENSALIINGDNDMLGQVDFAKGYGAKYDVVRVGEGIEPYSRPDYKVSQIQDYGDKGIEYILTHKDKDYKVKLNVPGAHNSLNATLAIGAMSKIGISVEEAIEGLKGLVLTGNRLNVMVKGDVRVIDDTYNACPASIISAVNTLMATKVLGKGRRIAILGDVFELGDESENSHRQVGRYVGEKRPDMLIAVGKDAEFYAQEAEKLMGSEKVRYYSDRNLLKSEINDVIKPNDVILVKASNGMKLKEIVDKIME